MDNKIVKSNEILLDYINDEKVVHLSTIEDRIIEIELLGTVYNEDTGEPIEDACINVVDSELNPILHLYTDNYGRFYVTGAMSSEVKLIVSKQGYVTKLLIDLESIKNVNSEIQVILKQTNTKKAVLVGYLKDDEQRPIIGAKVMLIKGRDVLYTTYTNSEGLYIMDAVEYDEFKLECQSNLHIGKTIAIDINTELSTVRTIYLKKQIVMGALYGLITNNKGEPVQNAAVVLFNSENIPIRVTYTGENGIYVFSKLKQGTYYIVAKN